MYALFVESPLFLDLIVFGVYVLCVVLHLLIFYSFGCNVSSKFVWVTNKAFMSNNILFLGSICSKFKDL